MDRGKDSSDGTTKKKTWVAIVWILMKRVDGGN